MKKTIIICVLLFALLLTGCQRNGYNAVTAPTTSAQNELTAKIDNLTEPTAAIKGFRTLSATLSTSEEKLLEVEYEGGSYASGTGMISGNSKRIRLKGYLKIEDVKRVEIGEGYQLAWFAYDKDYNFLGNGTGGWLADGEDIDATVITTAFAQYADAVYFTFAFRNMPNTAIDVATDVEAAQIKVYAFGYADFPYYPEITPPDTDADTAPPTTDSVVPETTKAPETTKEPEQTTEPAPETTVAPETGDTTDAPTPEQTQAQQGGEQKTEEKKGCGGFVAGGVALVAILGTAIIIKKRD